MIRRALRKEERDLIAALVVGKQGYEGLLVGLPIALSKR